MSALYWLTGMWLAINVAFVVVAWWLATEREKKAAPSRTVSQRVGPLEQTRRPVFR